MATAKKAVKKTEKKSVKKGTGFIVMGSNYLIRTVTMIYTGKIIKENAESFMVDTCCWIPETARWTQCVKNSEFNEVEPYPFDRSVIIFKSGILDMVVIDKLPTDQK